MASALGKRKPSKAKRRRQETRQAKPAAPTAAPVQLSGDIRDPGELPSRTALIVRLEAQRAELLRAMSCVDRARRTIEQHVAAPPFGGAIPPSPEQHQFYRQRVLEDLNDAGDALRTAYPMLERIAQGLAVEEILKEHKATTGTASEAEPKEGPRPAGDRTTP